MEFEKGASQKKSLGLIKNCILFNKICYSPHVFRFYIFLTKKKLRNQKIIFHSAKYRDLYKFVFLSLSVSLFSSFLFQINYSLCSDSSDACINTSIRRRVIITANYFIQSSINFH